jgi:hypothetical protein
MQLAKHSSGLSDDESKQVVDADRPGVKDIGIGKFSGRREKKI